MQPPIDFLSQPLYLKTIHLMIPKPKEIEEEKKIGVEKLNIRDNIFGK